MAETSLTQIIKRIGSEGMPDIVIGVVTKSSPLEIVLKDDVGVQLHSQSLLIGANKGPFTKGKEFYMISTRGGKMYYLLDPVADEEYCRYPKCKACDDCRCNKCRNYSAYST